MDRSPLILTAAVMLACGVAATAQSAIADARDLLDHQRYREAARLLESSVGDMPDHPEAYEMLANAYLGLKQPDKAVLAVERGLDANSGSNHLESYYVALLRRTLPPAEARTRIFNALNVSPNSPVFQKAAARLLMETDPQDEKAGALLAMAARSLPDDAEAHFFFGQWLCVNQREEACITELTAAANRTRGDNYEAMAQIFALLGTAQMNTGHSAEAESAWERAMRANRKSERPSPELSIRYSAFLRKNKREHEADDVLRETLRKYPNFGPAHFEAAEVAFSRNDTDTAEREARKALEFRGYNKEARNNIHMFLASVYASAGRIADADRERAETQRRAE